MKYKRGGRNTLQRPDECSVHFFVSESQVERFVETEISIEHARCEQPHCSYLKPQPSLRNLLLHVRGAQFDPYWGL